MTAEIVQFKCPSCGHLLGEEEYRHACEKNLREVDEKVERQLQQQIKQVKINHAKEIYRLNQKNETEREKEVTARVSKVVSEQRVWIELKHKQDLATKDKQIEAAKMQSFALIDEKIRDAITENESKHRQREKEFELQHSRIEADNKKLMDQVEKLQETLDNIPPELRGTAGEFVLLDELKKEFGRDDITSKKVGVAMADIIQVIVTEKGEKISTPIVYDKKTGDNVTALDIIKAKKYKGIHNTNYCIIVTKNIKENRFTEEREGILLVHPMAVIDIAKQIRSYLIQLSKYRKTIEGTTSKQAKLYEYLTGPEYDRDLRTRLDVKSNLDELQRKEEDYTKSVWSRRKGFIDKWFELDTKLDACISQITQEDDSDNDGDNPST